MHAETIAIGTELTTGAKLDTNSQWLSQQLAAVGISTLFHTTVADDLAANLQAVQLATQRADVVIITGGLGPTLDDLTREVLAKAAGVELKLDEPAFEHIRSMFACRNRIMPERNVVQAMFPEGSTIIPNPRGTAPGIWLEFPRADGTTSCLAALPGVPSEMKPMFLDWVLPRLHSQGGTAGTVIRSALVQIFGLGESQAEEMLGDLTQRGRDPEVGITVHEATITLRIEAHGQSICECEDKIEDARRLARERLGSYVFGDDDEELQDVVIRQLQERGATVATVEEATGGLVAHWLTSVPGGKDQHRGGWVGSTATLAEQLFVATPYSFQDVVEAWRKHVGAEYALGVGMLAGEPGEGKGLQAPEIELAWTAPEAGAAWKINVAGDPAILRSRTAKTVLNRLRLVLAAEM